MEDLRVRARWAKQDPNYGFIAYFFRGPTWDITCGNCGAMFRAQVGQWLYLNGLFPWSGARCPRCRAFNLVADFR